MVPTANSPTLKAQRAASGWGICTIAGDPGVGRKTLRKYFRIATCPQQTGESQKYVGIDKLAI